MKITFVLDTSDIDEIKNAVHVLQKIIGLAPKPPSDKNNVVDAAKKAQGYYDGLKVQPLSLISSALSTRTVTCLLSEEINTIGSLMSKSQNDLLRVPNLGRRSLKEILDALAFYGIKLQ